MFQPIRLARTAETVVGQIRDAVAAGALGPGDPLPGERHLAEQFGVSRTCVREALRILEAMGMVEVRQGRRSFITTATVGIESPTIWLPWISAHRDEVIELLDVREAIESKIAALAAIRATPDAINRAEQFIPAADEYLDAEAARSLDIGFHEALAQACGSPLLAKLSRSIGGAMATDRLAVFALPGRIQGSAREHRAVLDAVVRRDPEAARQAMSSHVESVKVDIFRHVRSDPTAAISIDQGGMQPPR